MSAKYTQMLLSTTRFIAGYVMTPCMLPFHITLSNKDREKYFP